MFSAALVAVAAGVLCAGVGLVVQRTPQPTDAIPFGPSQVHTVGERVPLVGPLVIYGTPPDGQRPTADELLCRVSDGGGELSVEAAVDQERIVVDGRGLIPLITFPGREGHSVACTGQGAVAAAPLFIRPGTSHRDLVPLALYCIAAVLLPLGAFGAVTVRTER